MHLLRRDLLAVQRRSLGKMLGAFEGADDYGIEARVSDQARGGLQRFLVVACDRYGNAPLGSVGVARYLTIFQRVECTNDAPPPDISPTLWLNLEKGRRQVKARLPLR